MLILAPRARAGSARPAPGPPCHLRTFGGFCLLRAGRPSPAALWRRQSAKLIVVCLLLAEGRAVPKSELCGVLWPDAGQAQAANRLRVALCALRQALEPERPAHRPSAFLAADRQTCALLPDAPLTWDVGLLRAALALAAAQPGCAHAALAPQVEALQGPWLPDLDAAGDFSAARWHLNSLAAGAAVQLGEAALAGGEVRLARTAAERAAAVDPGSEEAYGLLLRVCAAAGPPRLVQRTYDFVCAQLLHHADAAPGPWLRSVAAEALARAGG